MNVRLICPAPPRSVFGNRITALRWAKIIRSLGHRVTIAECYSGEPCGLLIAMHARRSAEAVFKSRSENPERPVIVALTGTDLYRDLPRSSAARKALELADRIVALQPMAAAELEPRLRVRVRVIYQSAYKTRVATKAHPGRFVVSVAGHLRPVKDPFRAAYASRLLPPESKISILHFGAAMEEAMARKARAEQARNPRYRWLGAVPALRARRLIAASRVLVLSSRMEGGANVISEALVDGVPVLASCIPGSVGLLGSDYPGLFPIGDTEALASLMARAENDGSFYRELKTRCTRIAPLFSPSRERAAWRRLLGELAC